MNRELLEDVKKEEMGLVRRKKRVLLEK